jgi:polyphosphate kinase 2 (PPK2 family)
MKINSKDFRVRPGQTVKLQKWPTIVKPFFKSKKRYQELLEKRVVRLSKLQRLHWASNRYALLLIFQGMDAAGKDGAIQHVMSGVNPQGCQVFSFNLVLNPMNSASLSGMTSTVTSTDLEKFERAPRREFGNQNNRLLHKAN